MSSEFQNRLSKGLEHGAPEQHPTADVLNAYGERLLPEGEERQVLAHLSVCADCREVVYLASGSVEEEVLPEAKGAPARRIHWWTWAVPLLAVLIVGSTTFVLQSKRLNRTPAAPPPEVAQARRDVPLESSPPPVVSQSSEEQSRTAAPKVSHPGAEKDALSKKKDVGEQAGASLKQEERRDKSLDKIAANAGAPAAEPQATRQYESKAENPASAARPALAAPVPVGAQTQTVEVTGANAMVETQADSSQITAQNVPAKKEALAGFARAKSSMQALNVAAQWRVTNDGKLEHLLLGEWKPAAGTPHAVFLTIASAGKDVWAGGKGLALFHSPDNGLHWERQTLPAINADILHIEFSSSTTGILKTRSAGAFFTQDGGKTWTGVDPSLVPAP
jgi:hypothetical protein